LLILFHIGVIIAWKKNRLLTALMALPSLCLFLGILAINQFATRYAFFLAFLFLLYTAVLIGFMKKRFGNWSYLALAALIIIPSNLINPLTFTTIIKPVDYNLNDPTAPTVDAKAIPDNIIAIIMNSTSIAFFSPATEWYIEKPDYIIPFSMSGIGNDTISRDGRDIYSGAPIISQRPQGNYTLIADEFAISKLKPYQEALLKNLTESCKELYKNPSLTVYGC
jgi:hypothetical protein